MNGGFWIWRAILVFDKAKQKLTKTCRAGVTFKYTPDGPVGLLTGKR
ncbi:MAG: FMN-dependent NADH-azoreductase, partial [Yoonia sp.]